MATDLTLREDLYDKIERFYKGEGKLTETEQRICQRWELAFSMLCQVKNKRLAINKYRAALLKKGENISLPSAYRDFANAEQIFTPIHKLSKEFQRMVIIESCEKDINRLRRLQDILLSHYKGNERLSEKDRKSFNAYQDQIAKCQEIKIKAGGLQQDDPNLPDFSQIQMPDIQVNIPMNLQASLRKIIQLGSLDATTLLQLLSSDIQTVIPIESNDNETDGQNT